MSSVRLFRVCVPGAARRATDESVIFLQWDSSSLSSCVMWRCSSFRMDSLVSRPDRRSVTRFLSRLRDDSEPANHRHPREEKACAKMEPEGGGARPGGMIRSLICASLMPSHQRRSRSCRQGRVGETRADRQDQAKPATLSSLRPEDRSETGLRNAASEGLNVPAGVRWYRGGGSVNS